MVARDDNAPTIVIKKKKKGGHDAHHGGQWKVAYADFVTAMMAFFLMLWLLNATTEEQRNGIADYFSPTSVSKSTSGGGGMLAGQTIAKDGALVHNRAPIGVNIKLPPAQDLDTPENANDDGKADVDAAEEEALRRELAQREKARFEAAEAQLRQAIQANPELVELQDQLKVEQTEEGLHIQLMDRMDSSMFQSGSANPKPRTEQLLTQVAQAIADLPNEVAIKGHTDAVPFARTDGYSNWELSADRANAARRILEAGGLGRERIAEVVGLADHDLLLPDQPESPRNRRISIVLLREQPLLPQPRPASAAPQGQPANDAPAPRERRIGPSILGDDDGSGG